jgi:hypothetical protein
MFTAPVPFGRTGLAARLAVDEVAALAKVIEIASDGDLVKNWSTSTITNVLYSVEPTDRIVLLVRQAQCDSLSFAAHLDRDQTDRNQTSIEALRRAAMQSVQGLIYAMKNG